MKSKMKKICGIFIVVLILSSIMAVPQTVQARDAGRFYKEKFTFMTEPIQNLKSYSIYHGMGDIWCEKYLSHYLEITVKGKKPDQKLLYYTEMLDKSYAEDIPKGEWKYNSSKKTWTARHKLKKLYGFTYFALYEKNAKPRKATVRLLPDTNTTVQNFRVAGKPGYIKLSWKKIAGYIQILRAGSVNGKYKKIKEVYGNEGCYLDKKVKAGKKYYYKIRLISGASSGKREQTLYLKCTSARGTSCKAKAQAKINTNVFKKKDITLFLSEITWNTKFKNSTELKKILPTMVRKHFSIYAYKGYPEYDVPDSKDCWYYLVPKKDVHKWIKDTFGLTVNKVNLPQKNGKYMIWQLWWQGIEEPKVTKVTRTKDGAIIILKEYIGSSCTNTYTINVRAANNSRGFVIKSVK